MPVSPWDPVSLCPGNACADNPDKCFRPTHLAPILHEGDISLETRPYMVSGVSVTQEASNKPDNVYHWYGDVSEDATGTGEIGKIVSKVLAKVEKECLSPLWPLL